MAAPVNITQAMAAIDTLRAVHNRTPTPSQPTRSFPDENIIVVTQGAGHAWMSSEKQYYHTDLRNSVAEVIGSERIDLGNQEDVEFVFSQKGLVLGRLIIFADTLRSCAFHRTPDSPGLSLRYITPLMILDLLKRSFLENKAIGLHIVRVSEGFQTRNPNIGVGDWILAAKFESGDDRRFFFFTDDKIPGGFSI